ncbi:MAG: hypothetical protein IJ473_01750 [Alphaproteobacteria bacterium]|nr:hypothetical protein [Alphaproteobacteria bacterium]
MERVLFLLTSIICLSIMFCFGIKHRNGHNKIDLVFIILFFLSLCIPAIWISMDKINEIENKPLQTFPQLTKENSINPKFGEEFDNYFNDRFFGRDNILNFYTDLQTINKIIKGKESMFFPENGWMFRKFIWRTFLNYNAQKNLNNFKNYLEKKGIKLYVIFVPSKIHVYNEYAPILLNTENYFGWYFKEIIDHFKEATLKERFIFPINSFLSVKDFDYLYYKTDHHWTNLGAYVAYQDLAKIIKKDFKDFKITPLSKFNRSISKKIHSGIKENHKVGSWMIDLRYNQEKYYHLENTPYSYFDTGVKIKKYSDDCEFFDIKNENGKYNVYVLGNSMSFQFIKFFDSVKNLHFVFANHIKIPINERWKFKKYYEKDLEKHKPDMFILVMNDYDLSLLNQFNPFLTLN